MKRYLWLVLFILCVISFGLGFIYLKNKTTDGYLANNEDCGTGRIGKFAKNIIITPNGQFFGIKGIPRWEIGENEKYGCSYNPGTNQLFLFRIFDKPQRILGMEFLGEVGNEITPSVVLRVERIKIRAVSGDYY